MGLQPAKAPSQEEKKVTKEDSDYIAKQLVVVNYHKARYEKDLLLAEKDRPFVRGQWVCYYTDEEGKDRVKASNNRSEVLTKAFVSCFMTMADVPMIPPTLA